MAGAVVGVLVVVGGWSLLFACWLAVRRATELGILLGGADRTTHPFGRRITARYGGKLQTVLDRRNEGQPILRSYYGSSFVKQYEKGDRLLRTETCVNNTYDLGIGRRLPSEPRN